jgi:AP-3 complex subunit beta
VIVGNAVLVLKSLVQHQAESFDSTRLHLSIIAKLAQRIEQFHHPQAKACVIWLVGQYAPEEPVAASPISGIASWAPDVLRRTTKTFITEVCPTVNIQFHGHCIDGAYQPVIVKLQVLTLAAKLVTLAPTNQTLVLITRFVLSMSRYDADYDVRDRARSLLGLLRGVAPGVQEDGMDTELSGVVLRREQVRLVLFTGKVAAKPEDARKGAMIS